MKNEKSHVSTDDGGKPPESVSSRPHSRQSVGTYAGRDRASGIVVEEVEGDAEVTPEALDRALELLSAWALRHGRKVLEDVGIDSENLVTGGVIKGYGGKNEPD